MASNELEARLKKITAFFHGLGLNTDGDVQSPAYWADLHKIIEDETKISMSERDLEDPMGETVVDLFFSTPDIAGSFLAADLPRLTQVLLSLDTLKGLPAAPRSVAEIGGGPGIACLWLALQWPETRFTVYDQSENALAVGRTWARRLSLGNVRYERARYDELAGRLPKQRYDLILGLGALNLMDSGPHLSASGGASAFSSSLQEPIDDFAKACHNHLASKGVLYFSQGSFNDSGLLLLFEAFRQHDLGFDWRHTFCAAEGEGPAFSIKAIHLFLRPGRSTVFSSAHEDLASFLMSGKMARFSDKILLGHGDFESWLSLLSHGIKLADIKALHPDGLEERHSIYVKAGFLGFFSSNTGGSRSGFIYNAASFEATVSRLLGIVEHFKKKNITLTRTFLHPYFK